MLKVPPAVVVYQIAAGALGMALTGGRCLAPRGSDATGNGLADTPVPTRGV